MLAEGFQICGCENAVFLMRLPRGGPAGRHDHDKYLNDTTLAATA